LHGTFTYTATIIGLVPNGNCGSSTLIDISQISRIMGCDMKMVFVAFY
jgi:hypothetical protein